MAQVPRNWKVIDLEPAVAGDNTIIPVKTGISYLAKHLILMCDSATDIYFKNTKGTKKTNTFYFPHVGGFCNMEALNLAFGPDQAIILVSSQAANISMMIDLQGVAVC